jgi:hypothetical protein
VVQDFRSILVLSVVTVMLVSGVIIAATINPYALLGLAPVLLAIAAIVRAIRGGPRDGPGGSRPRKKVKK